MVKNINTVRLAHHFIRSNVKAGDLCIDATAGRGRDSVFLAELVQQEGKVISFDVQKDAIESTKELLNQKGLEDRVQLVLDGHQNMQNYAELGTVDCIVFNLGWLPGGDHNIFTLPDTTVEAIDAGLELLKPGGIMSISIYYGREMGNTEKDVVLEHLRNVNPEDYTVLVTEFANRPNNPPIPVFITRDR